MPQIYRKLCIDLRVSKKRTIDARNVEGKATWVKPQEVRDSQILNAKEGKRKTLRISIRNTIASELVITFLPCTCLTTWDPRRS